MNTIMMAVMVLGLIAMGIGLAMLYLQAKGLEGMMGDVVRMVDGVDVRATDVQTKVEHLIVRGKRGPKKKPASVTSITGTAG